MIHTAYQGLTPEVTRAISTTNSGVPDQKQTTSTHHSETQISLSEGSQQALARSQDNTVTSHEVQSPVSLHDLPPLEFFNQADVDAYDEHLMETLAKYGIDTSQPIDFGFAYDGSITVKNEHPDKEAIETVFSEDMDLRNGLIQTSNFYMFQELASLNEQWAEKLASGMSEEVAGQWLVNAAKSATAKNGQGISYAGGHSQDPFSNSANNTLASRAYGA